MQKHSERWNKASGTRKLKAVWRIETRQWLVIRQAWERGLSQNGARVCTYRSFSWSSVPGSGWTTKCIEVIVSPDVKRFWVKNSFSMLFYTKFHYISETIFSHVSGETSSYVFSKTNVANLSRFHEGIKTCPNVSAHTRRKQIWLVRNYDDIWIW